MIEDNVVKVDETATALHYGQQCFEGLKAYRCKDGSINLFRADQNAARMARSCRRLLVPRFPEERFVESCEKSGEDRSEQWFTTLRNWRKFIYPSVHDWGWKQCSGSSSNGIYFSNLCNAGRSILQKVD